MASHRQTWAHCLQHDCEFWDCLNRPHFRGPAGNKILDWYRRTAPRAMVRSAELLAFAFAGPPDAWLERLEQAPRAFLESVKRDPEVRELADAGAVIVFWIPVNNDPNTWELPV